MVCTAFFTGWSFLFVFRKCYLLLLFFFATVLVQLKGCSFLMCPNFSKLEKIETAAETFKFASSLENASPVPPPSLLVALLNIYFC
jgi:hypothetical protein